MIVSAAEEVDVEQLVARAARVARARASATTMRSTSPCPTAAARETFREWCRKKGTSLPAWS